MMRNCDICGAALAKINGRTLKEALQYTRAFFGQGRFSSTQWVDVCPICDAYALGSETAHPWPFRADDGVMRVVDDYSGISERKCLDFCGFKFTENALLSADAWLRGSSEDSRAVESLGSALGSSSSDQQFLEFSQRVCEWGRGQRVWGNLLRHHGHEYLAWQLKKWLVPAIASTDDEAAISLGSKIKGLGVSFASKHLRMLKPDRYAVLDNVFCQGLGIALNPRGYRLFMTSLRNLAGQLAVTMRAANLEAAIFLLIRQEVRAGNMPKSLEGGKGDAKS